MLSSQLKPPLQPLIHGPYSLCLTIREHPTHCETHYFDTREDLDEVVAHVRYLHARADERNRPIAVDEFKYFVRSVLMEVMKGTAPSPMKTPNCYVMIERCDAH